MGLFGNKFRHPGSPTGPEHNSDAESNQRDIVRKALRNVSTLNRLMTYCERTRGIEISLSDQHLAEGRQMVRTASSELLRLHKQHDGQPVMLTGLTDDIDGETPSLGEMFERVAFVASRLGEWEVVDVCAPCALEYEQNHGSDILGVLSAYYNVVLLYMRKREFTVAEKYLTEMEGMIATDSRFPDGLENVRKLRSMVDQEKARYYWQRN